jgi:hypothetical protein
MARSTSNGGSKSGEDAGLRQTEDATDHDAENGVVVLMELVTELA